MQAANSITVKEDELFGSSLLSHRGTQGSQERGTRNEETRNFFKHTLIQHGTYTKDLGRLDV